MGYSNEFHVLVGTDGSTQARGALAVAMQFPWPAGTRVRTVVARRMGQEHQRSILLAALDRGADSIASSAQRRLRRRWPDAEAVVVDKGPVAGVLSEAERFGAHVIVLGWRGHGPIRRALMGSVSRGVVRGARCSVLVVRRRPADVRRILIGIDGSPGAQVAVSFAEQARGSSGWQRDPVHGRRTNSPARPGALNVSNSCDRRPRSKAPERSKRDSGKTEARSDRGDTAAARLACPHHGEDPRPRYAPFLLRSRRSNRTQ